MGYNFFPLANAWPMRSEQWICVFFFFIYFDAMMALGNTDPKHKWIVDDMNADVAYIFNARISIFSFIRQTG